MIFVSLIFKFDVLLYKLIPAHHHHTGMWQNPFQTSLTKEDEFNVADNIKVQS